MYGSAARRLAGILGKAFPRRQPYRGGWDPREPTFLGFATALMVAALVLPWWGFEADEIDPKRGTLFEESVQFGPWVTTHWFTVIAPGGFYVRRTPVLWWDLPEAFPEYAGYAPVAALLSGLWSAAFVLAAFALWARAIPRRRFSGWPTVAEGVASCLLVLAVFVGTFAFPFVGEFPSFSGASSDGGLTWGPGFGWFTAIGGIPLAIAATLLGLRVDRRLVGVCWCCFRPVSHPKCGFCGSAQ